MKLLTTTIAALTIATAATHAATIFTENFDVLTTDQSLSGQGGWSHVGGGNNVTVATDPGKFGFSGNIAQGGSDSQYSHTIPAGLNDIDIATVSMDLQINGDNTYAYWLLGSSFSLGVETGNMVLRNANGGNKNYDHNLTGDNIYRLTMMIDPTAFSGAGSATVTFAQYTAENTLGAATTAFSNIELRLDETNRALSKINNSILRIARPIGVDNLSISQIPEPSSAGLLGLAGLALIFRRRKSNS